MSDAMFWAVALAASVVCGAVVWVLEGWNAKVSKLRSDLDKLRIDHSELYSKYLAFSQRIQYRLDYKPTPEPLAPMTEAERRAERRLFAMSAYAANTNVCPEGAVRLAERMIKELDKDERS